MIHRRLQDVGQPEPTVATIGFFDGVHLGHRSVIDRVVEEGRTRDMRSAVVTFDPHPREILTAQPVSLLTSLAEKSTILAGLGVDLVVVIPFDRSLSELSPREFLMSIMIGRIGLSHLVVGYDHAIGRGAAGDAETIGRIGQEVGFTTDILGPVTGPVGEISSSKIRAALRDDGNVKRAAHQLGRPYRLTGEVVVGDGRGRQLGFPTANLSLTPSSKLVPANGVYAVNAEIEEDEDGRGEIESIMNIGVRPTLTSARRRVLEVHLLDFSGDLYGRTLHVSFVDRVRDERKFDGPDELRRQIQSDIVDCIAIHRGVS